jgi:hypothetical protein
MTELEKIKSDIAQLVNRIDELQNKSNEDVFILNKEQLIEYTQRIMKLTLQEAQITIERFEIGDECVDISISKYDLRLEIDIDSRVPMSELSNEIINLDTDVITVEPFVINTLTDMGYFKV